MRLGEIRIGWLHSDDYARVKVDLMVSVLEERFGGKGHRERGAYIHVYYDSYTEARRMVKALWSHLCETQHIGRDDKLGKDKRSFWWDCTWVDAIRSDIG